MRAATARAAAACCACWRAARRRAAAWFSSGRTRALVLVCAGVVAARFVLDGLLHNDLYIVAEPEYRAGVEALGTQSYATLQVMQIVGERNVRIVPDVAVNGSGTGSGLVDALIGTTLKDRIVPAAATTPAQV